MTRRRIVDPKECSVCAAAEARPEGDPRLALEEAFAAGYIAGRHATAKGDRAEERFCADHARLLDDAVIEYVHRGVAR